MPARVIDVPKTDAGAFNPNRPAGKLLQAQSMHLREALIQHLHELTTLLAVDLRSLKTEAQVGEYTRKITAILHPQGVPRSGK